jgi:hypothetical protein
MITDLYDLEHDEEKIAKELIKQIRYFAEAKNLQETEKFNIKFKIGTSIWTNSKRNGSASQK